MGQSGLLVTRVFIVLSSSISSLFAAHFKLCVNVSSLFAARFKLCVNYVSCSRYACVCVHVCMRLEQSAEKIFYFHYYDQMCSFV